MTELTEILGKSYDDADFQNFIRQEAQLSPSDRAMRLVSSNLANYHATVQKLLRAYTTSPDQTDGMKLEV